MHRATSNVILEPSQTDFSAPTALANPVGQELASGNFSRRTWIGWAWMLLLAVSLILGWSNGWFDAETLEKAKGLPPVAFWLAMTFLPLAGFPISVTYICIGAFFPPLTAFLLGSSSLLVSMTLGYLIGRHWLRVPVQRVISRRWPQLLKLSPLQSYKATILVRAVPGVPYFLQNYGLGLLKIRFSMYLALSWSIQSMIMLSVILTVRGSVEKDFWVWLPGLGGLIVLFTIIRFLTFRGPAKDSKAFTSSS